jgi:hypothetical protein
MLRRHADILMHRIETLADKGFVFVEFRELTRWYDMARVTKSIWRDLKERFDEVTPDADTELYIYQTINGVLLIHSDGLKKITVKMS